MITEARCRSSARHTADHPELGNIMAEGRALWQVKPYIVFFPAIFCASPCCR